MSLLEWQAAQRADVKDLQRRQDDVERLEADIVDIDRVFKDMALVVHEQVDASEVI